MYEGFHRSLKRCSICNSYAIEHSSSLEYVWCALCGTIRTKYKYDGDQYGQRYADNYINYANSPVNQSLNLFRLGLISRWLTPESRILDVGCCVGEFLRFAEKYYNSCYGFEPNEIAANRASERTRSCIIMTELNGNSRFDCITMFDVLEHIEDPIGFLGHCKTILKSNGILTITTPSLEAVPFGDDTTLRKWKHWKPKEHLYLYTEMGIMALLSKIGMEPIHWGHEESDIRPQNPNGDIMTCVARKKS